MAEALLKKNEQKEKMQKRKRSEEATSTTEEQTNEETKSKDNVEVVVADDDDKKLSKKSNRKLDRDALKKEKEELMKQVPKVDGDGLSYTKLQIKRMVKRVKRGLAPVPTEEEENQRRRQDKIMRREEEEELAGMLAGGDDDDDDADDAEEEEEQEKEADADDDEETEQKGAESGDDDSDAEEKDEEPEPPKKKKNTNPPSKKTKRAKPVPANYVCQACKNKHQTPHWIYDCPDKVTVKGTNKTAKKLRGLNEPDSRKVFVSGLSFEAKAADVEKLFEACGTVASCKLVKFGDTGRCNGQAYVSFGTDEGAKKALKLSGTMVENIAKEDPKKKGKKSESETVKRVQLKLKVSKVLNRQSTGSRNFHQQRR